ncbi:MAG: TlpA family protein disulfide reductase [SAR202 cluster bacterium]|nr:TlpA family protein disulfide reductase [SAR202 cluster bacterium]
MSRRWWILLAAGAPVLGLVALLAWASVQSGGRPASFGINRQLGEVAVEARPAEEFILPLLDGSSISLAELRGNVVVLDFWASWCPPCQEEAPALAKVYREYAGREVQFVGVDIWDRPEDAQKFTEKYGVTYPSGVDDRGRIAINYGVKGIPEKFFIDRGGVLRRKFVGPMDETTLRRVLDDLLAGGRKFR